MKVTKVRQIVMEMGTFYITRSDGDEDYLYLRKLYNTPSVGDGDYYYLR